MFGPACVSTWKLFANAVLFLNGATHPDEAKLHVFRWFSSPSENTGIITRTQSCVPLGGLKARPNNNVSVTEHWGPHQGSWFPFGVLLKPSNKGGNYT